jgi:hypothetical protein
MNEKNVIYYSLLSGDVYEVDFAEIDNLDEFQIPLLDYPNPKCNRCHGRGYVGYDTTKKYYLMCRCTSKYIDRERMNSK